MGLERGLSGAKEKDLGGVRVVIECGMIGVQNNHEYSAINFSCYM